MQDRQGEGVDLSSLGQIALARGRLEEASEYFQQSLTIRPGGAGPAGGGRGPLQSGPDRAKRGRLEEASEYFQQSLTIHREVQDRQGEGVVLSNLGQIALTRGRLEEASSTSSRA